MENKSSDKITSRAGLPRPTLIAASGFVLLAAIGLWAINLLAPFLPTEAPTKLIALVNIIYYVPFIILPVAVYMLKRRGLSDAVRLNPVPVLPVMSVIFLALTSTLVSGMITALWSALLDLIGLSMDAGTVIPTTKQELMLSVITAAAIPAVCEELLFRGVVMSAWESRGTKFAVIVSAVLFALMHGNIYGLPAYLIIGALSGYLVFALDSVYVGMIFHTVYNTACLVLNYATVTDPAAEAAASSMGAISMLLSAALDLLFVVFVTAITLATLRIRRKLMGIEPLPRVRQPLNPFERTMLVLCIIPMLTMILVL